jgi:hypothetical protein
VLRDHTRDRPVGRRIVGQRARAPADPGQAVFRVGIELHRAILTGSVQPTACSGRQAVLRRGKHTRVTENHDAD